MTAMNTKQKAEAWLKEVAKSINTLEPSIRADHERYIEIITALLKEREALLGAVKPFVDFPILDLIEPSDKYTMTVLGFNMLNAINAITLCEKEHE